MKVAALIVTHNSQSWIQQVLESVLWQTHVLDNIVVIDDNSSDETIQKIVHFQESRIHLETSKSTSRNTTTRVADNFQQGIALLLDHDYIILGDHDDVWRRHRVAHQLSVLERQPSAAMVASDGQLMGSAGVGSTLRSVFAVPLQWSKWSGREQMTYALQHSIATGGASALRAKGMEWTNVPRNWLHDRWWSLSATAQRRMIIDNEIVLDYRVSAHQHTGLARGTQESDVIGRIGSGLRHLPMSLQRLRDLHSLRTSAADASISEVLTWFNLIRIKVFAQ